MSGEKTLMRESDLHYIYDGTLDGFYCCVYESVYARAMPAVIEPEHEAQPSLMLETFVVTDAERAAKVRGSVPKKISRRSLELVETVFLSCLEFKEMKMLRYLLLGYKEGPIIDRMLGHADVAPLLAAERHLHGESHLLRGFIRFTDYDGVLAAVISPKNFVLPSLARHFAGRYNAQQFMIYDKTHKYALLHTGGRTEILRMEQVEFPAPSPEEKEYRELWKQFYKTIAIEARENPKCRMTLMPKRYWENMTEMAPLL